MTLLEYVQQKLNESGTDAKIPAAMISMYLDRHRLLDPRRVYQAFRYTLDATTEIDEGTGLVTVTLRELYDTYQHYAGIAGLYMHPTGLQVLADGALVAAEEYTFDAAQLTLLFATAFPGATQVQVVGHLVNIDGPYGVMYDCIGVLAGWVAKFVNTRGQEFKGLHRNLKAWQQEYAAGVVHVR